MSEQDKKWSDRVTRSSDALDLEEGVFTWKDEDHYESAWTTHHGGEASEPVQFSVVRQR